MCKRFSIPKMTPVDFYSDICNVDMNNNNNSTTYFASTLDDKNYYRDSLNFTGVSSISENKNFYNLFFYNQLETTNNITNDLFYKAIELGKEENIKLLLDYGTITIDDKDIFGKTPLHFIANLECQDKKKMTRIAKLLLDSAPNPKVLALKKYFFFFW